MLSVSKIPKFSRNLVWLSPFTFLSHVPSAGTNKFICAFKKELRLWQDFKWRAVYMNRVQRIHQSWAVDSNKYVCYPFQHLITSWTKQISYNLSQYSVPAYYELNSIFENGDRTKCYLVLWHSVGIWSNKIRKKC